MAEVGSAFVSVLPSAKGFGRSLDSQIGGDVKSSGSRMGKVFGSAMKVGLLAAGAGLVAVGGAFAGAVKAAAESEKITAQTAAVLKSTGGAANVSAKQVQNLGNEISAYSGLADESVRESQNMLLTFTKVRNEAGKGNDVFTQATKSIADMSVALGTDMKSSSLQVGKALNDPVKGVTALTRSGVSFTQQQKDQIEAMQESGDMLGAQKMILGELETQFGGAAKAAGSTFSGAVNKLKNAFGDTLRDAVMPMLPALTSMTESFAKHLPGAMQTVIGFFGRLVDYIRPAFDTLRGMFSGGAGGGIVASIKSSFLPVLQTAADTFRNVILPAVLAVASYLSANLLPIFRQVARVISDQVVPIVASLGQFLYGTLYPAIVGVARSVAKNLKPVFDQLFKTIRGSVIPTIQKLLERFREWQPTIQKVITVLVRIIGWVLKFAAAVLGKLLPPLIRFAAFMVGKVVGAVSIVVGWLVKFIGWLVKVGAAIINAGRKSGEFVSAVRSKFGEAVDFVRGIPGRIVAALGDLGDTLRDAGAQLIQGLINGITSKLDDIGDVMGKVAGKVKGFLPGSPVKEGPLRSWNNGAAGQRLMDLLAVGITSDPVTTAMDQALRPVARPTLALDDTFAGSAGSARGGALINVYDRSGDPRRTARETARQMQFAGAS